MKLTKITWVDAVFFQDENISKFIEKPTKDFLVETETYGKIIKEDKDGIVILMEKRDDGDGSVCIIPKRWKI